MAATGEKFERAVSIMARLRAPDGCPWDREQSFDTIKPYLLEETYEVLEAIDNRDWPGARRRTRRPHAARIFRSRGRRYDAPNAARKIEFGVRRQEVGVGYQHPLCRAPNSLLLSSRRASRSEML